MKIESSIKQINNTQQNAYETLSDLTNIQKIKDRIPEGDSGNPDMEKAKEKLQGMQFDRDSISVDVSPIGNITMRIVEREEPKMIKFESENSPMNFTFWIQLLPVTESTSKMRLTIDADVPFFAKAMVKKPLEEGIEKVAEALATVL